MREATVVSALDSAARAEELGPAPRRYRRQRKVSGVQDLVAIYRALAARCDYPLHLGLTEAGMGAKGIVASTAGTRDPAAGGHRRHDPRLADARARAATARRKCSSRRRSCRRLGLRAFLPLVVACPGCGRTTSSYFQELAQRIQEHMRERMPAWRRDYVGVEDMTVAVMGCVVNGPGESKHANIGISLPGTGERPVAPVYEDGEKTVTLKGERIAEEFQELVEHYVRDVTRAGRR